MNHCNGLGHQFETSHQALEGKARGANRIGALMAVIGAVACGQADELPSGSGGTGGGNAIAQAGANGADDNGAEPPTAPRCAVEFPSFVRVWAVPSGTVRPSATPGTGIRQFEGHLLERGYGLPEALSELPSDVSSPDELGWVLIEAVSSSAADAAPDAGDVERWTIVGPRPIAEMAVALGDTVQVRTEIRTQIVAAQHSVVVVKLGERVVLFHQDSAVEQFGDHEGFLMKRGAAVCQTTGRQGCTYSYHHDLEVTVPGGASATFALGEARTLGDYRMLHGNTASLVWRIENPNQGGGQCNDIFEEPNQLTAILMPSL